MAYLQKKVKDKYSWINKKQYHSSLSNVVNETIASALNDKDKHMKLSEGGIYVSNNIRLEKLSLEYCNYV